MLQNIRKYTQGTTAKIVVGLIVISFAFFGIESILLNGGGNEIAEVNGDPIYPEELQQALDTQKRRLVAMMGEKIDPAMLDDDRLRPQALEALINRKLLMQSAAAMKLAISEREIGTRSWKYGGVPSRWSFFARGIQECSSQCRLYSRLF